MVEFILTGIKTTKPRDYPLAIRKVELELSPYGKEVFEKHRLPSPVPEVGLIACEPTALSEKKVTGPHFYIRQKDLPKLIEKLEGVL